MGDATEIGFEETLERAWEKRHQWESMGAEASTYLKQKIVIDAEITFATHIISLIHE
jgi:hypothetical protein